MTGQRNGAIHRIRHARHRLTGWRKWLLIAFQAVVGFVLLFAVLNLALSLSMFRGENPAARTAHELRALRFSALDGHATTDEAFTAIYGDALGPRPDAGAIRAYFAAELDDGGFLLDQVMVDRMARFGGVDADVFPPGIYVGAHALGPDGPPWVYVTKYLAHYLLFPRHAYILVVPAEGPAIEFSASQNKLFPGATDHPDRLSARIERYTPQAYDFPGSGQAIHEMTLLTRDPDRVAGAVEGLEAARRALEASRTSYGVLAPNSNTVVGCILEHAGLITHERRTAMLLALRAPGFGAACPWPAPRP